MPLSGREQKTLTDHSIKTKYKWVISWRKGNTYLATKNKQTKKQATPNRCIWDCGLVYIVYILHLRLLLKCRFWPCGSGVRASNVLHFQLPPRGQGCWFIGHTLSGVHLDRPTGMCVKKKSENVGHTYFRVDGFASGPSRAGFPIGLPNTELVSVVGWEMGDPVSLAIYPTGCSEQRLWEIGPNILITCLKPQICEKYNG